MFRMNLLLPCSGLKSYIFISTYQLNRRWKRPTQFVPFAQILRVNLMYAIGYVTVGCIPEPSRPALGPTQPPIQRVLASISGG